MKDSAIWRIRSLVRSARARTIESQCRVPALALVGDDRIVSLFQLFVGGGTEFSHLPRRIGIAVAAGFELAQPGFDAQTARS